MSDPRLIDRSSLGYVVLQDHRTGLDPSRRSYLAGVRLVDAEDDPWQGWSFGKEEGQGTAADFHPYTFWAPQGGAAGERGFGSWSPMFAAESQGGGGGGGISSSGGGRILTFFGAGGSVQPGIIRSNTVPTGAGGGDISALPIRRSNYRGDPRYVERTLGQPRHLPTYPRGYRLIACAGTDEKSQQDLLLPADGRIVVPQRHGPDRMGTTFCDLSGRGALGSRGTYGTSPVDAPSQTLFFVVRGSANEKLGVVAGNALGLNGTRTQQGRMSGFVPFVGQLDMSSNKGEGGQGSGPPSTPTTGGDDGPSEFVQPQGPGGVPPHHPVPPAGGGQGPIQPGGGVDPGLRTPSNTVPTGGSDPTQGIGVGLVAHEAAGPWVVGHKDDKHKHDDTKDTGPRNAGHLHVDTYFYRDQENDAPHEHNFGVYPRPDKKGYPWVVELQYDPEEQHNFMGDAASGLWRRVAWVPLLGGGGDTPGDTPDEGEPRDPVTPTPGGPGDIGDGPGTPGDGTPGDGGPGDGGNVPGDTALPPGWTRAGDGGAIGPDGRWHPRAPGGTHNTVVPYDRSSERPEYVVNMPFQMAGTSHLWRGQGWNLNTTDLRTEGSSFQNAKRTLDRQPVVFRTEGFAPQNDAGDYQYTQRPFLSRVQGGTAATGAGVWSMPPVFAIEDYRDGAPSTSITYATTYRGFAPGVNVAFGLPNATQAVSDGGHTMGHNVTDSTLEISGIASGTISPVLRANAEEVFLAAPSTAAADGDISSNEVVFYVNDTDETLHAKGKDGDGDVIDVRLGQTICLQSYLELNQRSSEPENIHGGLQALSLADTLSNGDSITVTKGVGKIVLLVIAANDAVGDITVTGTSVDRDTGAETGSDTDTLTMTKISTDNSTTDAEGNAVFSWDDALITSKWFTGSVVLSTTTVDLTDVDVYAISFEQWNDTDTVVETFDVTAESTNTAAWAYWYLYSVIPGTGDLVDITTIASVEASDADTTASGAPALWRLRRGNLDTSLTGATDGIFIQAHLGPNNLTYWNDVTTKVWGRQ